MAPKSHAAGGLRAATHRALWVILLCLLLVPSLRAQPAPDAEAKPKTPLPTVIKNPPQQPPSDILKDPHLNKTPARATKGLDLVKMGWSYNCMECHRQLEVKWHRTLPRVEHEKIKLDHGNNRFCLNCHHPKNLNSFVDYDGSEIKEQDVVLLCARCHGTVHRDWKAGIHGRSNGHWDIKRGKQTRLRCIQCHDPHSPSFKPQIALPAPTYPKRAPQRGGSPHHSKPADPSHAQPKP